MKVKIINKSNNQNPFYQTSGSSGMDLRAFLSSSVILLPGERKLVPTGIYLEIPKDYEAQVRSRSGLALKKGISVLNSPGTIDADYRGEIGVILINSSKNQDSSNFKESGKSKSSFSSLNRFFTLVSLNGISGFQRRFLDQVIRRFEILWNLGFFGLG